jgi:DNA-binding response OmpR family regulator
MAKEAAGKYKILVVDDDADILGTMEMALGEFGQTVLTARDGQEALDRIEAEDPDIIVLDIMLPKRGGFLILQKIKGTRSAKGKRPLVCMVTGTGGQRHQQFSEQLGVDDYLAKPFPLGKLVEIVQGFLEMLAKGVPDAH